MNKRELQRSSPEGWRGFRSPEDNKELVHVKTYVVKPAEIERNWYVVDAAGMTL